MIMSPLGLPLTALTSNASSSINKPNILQYLLFTPLVVSIGLVIHYLWSKSTIRVMNKMKIYQ